MFLSRFTGGDLNNCCDHQLIYRVISGKNLKIVKLDFLFLIFIFFLIKNRFIFLQVGHSIGSYISVEMFKRSPEKVITFVNYSFVMLPSVEFLTMENLFADIVFGIVGEILYRNISIFGAKPTIQKAVYYWEDCRVKFLLCYE